MLWLEEQGLLQGEILDYGCGKGFDVEYYGIDGYDPYYAPEFPQKKYDVVVCNFVLNVVGETERNEIIASVRSLLKDDGVAFFTVRRDVKKEGVTSRSTEQWTVVLDFEVLRENTQHCIYKMEK